MIKNTYKHVIAVFVVLILSTTSVNAAIFGDVTEENFYYDAVEGLVLEGVLDVNDQFRPDDVVNRAELVKFAVTAIDGLANFDAPEQPTFKDVDPSDWYYDYVEAAVSYGIINGYRDRYGNDTGYFGPQDEVNRAEAAKIMVEAFAFPKNTAAGTFFSDVKVGSWYYEYVLTAFSNDLFKGYADGRYAPHEGIKRYQMANMTYKAMMEASKRYLY